MTATRDSNFKLMWEIVLAVGWGRGGGLLATAPACQLLSSVWNSCQLTPGCEGKFIRGTFVP